MPEICGQENSLPYKPSARTLGLLPNYEGFPEWNATDLMSVLDGTGEETCILV